MKRCFYIPTRVQWSTEPATDEQARLQQTVFTALRRAIESSAGGDSEISTTNFEFQEDAGEQFSWSRYQGDRKTYAVPSYDKGGALTEVPIEEVISFEDDRITGDRVVEQQPPFQGSLVLQLPGNHYVHVRSHRYAVSDNISRAYGWGRALFGAESWVIVAGASARGEIAYYVAALDKALTEADLRVQPLPSSGIPGAGGAFIGRVLDKLPGDYGVIAVGFRDGGYSAPTVEAFQQFTQQVREAHRQGDTALACELVRPSVFGPIDKLIAQGGDDNLEKAADLLAELNATAFAYLDWETKALYLRILVDAWTLEAQEVTIVEIIKSMKSQSELLAAIGILQQAGKYDKLFDDLDSQLWSLLVLAGERFGQPGGITFDFLVELLQQAGLVPRSLDEIISEIALGPAGPTVSAELLAGAEKSVLNFVAETKESVLSFGRFLRGTVEGIVMLIADPGKLFEGIGQLIKLVVMVDLARWGHKPSQDSLVNLLRSMEQKIVYGLKGAQVLGVSDKIRRRIRWALIWEIASWFIGVGEVKTILSSVGITEKLAGVARFIRALGLFGKAAEAERAVSKLEHLARLLSKVSVITHEENILRLISHLPEKDIARLGKALESVDVHVVQTLAEVAVKHPELAEAAQHAMGRAEALAALEKKAGKLTENLVQGFQRLAERSGFNNQELLNLMASVPAEHAELFMRAVQSIPNRAFGRGVGARSFGFFPNLAERPRSMQFLIDAGYDSFSALYRHSGYDIIRFEENLDALADVAKRFPAGQREVEYQRFLDRLQNNDPAALQELRDARNARRTAAGLPAIRSFTAAELDDIVRTTPDIQQIRQLAKQMDNSTAGSLFERWVNHYVFHEPVGTPRARLSLRRADNPHLNLERDRSSDFFLQSDGSLWDSKIYRSGGEIDVFQLDDYRKMEIARSVVTPDGQQRKVSTINYIFSDHAAAEVNRSTLHAQGGAEVWFIDDHGVLQHLN